MKPLPLDHIRRFHSRSSLYGRHGGVLLELPSGLLAYLVGILHQTPVHPPEATQEAWSRLLTPLGSNLLLPILYRRICSLPREYHPPEEIMTYLRRVFLRCRGLSLRIEQQLIEILGACEKAGIQVMVWKGAALARTAYPDPALRPSGDIDLLVRPAQFFRAASILKDLGYQSEEDWFRILQPYGFAEDFFPRRKHAGYVKIDIHWKLHPYEGAKGERDEKDLFSRSVSIRIGDTAFLTPCPVDALIIAAQHMLLRHPHESRLIWIMDISMLATQLKRPRQWRDLQESSVKWRARLALERAFKMASLWSGLSLPHGFQDFAAWPEPSIHEKRIFSKALSSRKHKRHLFALYWPGWKRPVQTGRFLFRLLFPHPAYVEWKYPVKTGMLLPLSYLRCWLGWAGWDTGTGPGGVKSPGSSSCKPTR